MPQVDFAPSIAALLGVPVPFGSVGKLSRELWDVAHSNDRHASQEAFAQALLKNAKQVLISHISASTCRTSYKTDLCCPVCLVQLYWQVLFALVKCQLQFARLYVFMTVSAELHKIQECL